jgi:membrane protease YdiL (CAAX protease family)
MLRKLATGDGDGGVIIWGVLVFALTFVGALLLTVGGLNLDQPPQAASMLPLFVACIFLTAYAPTLAALLVAAGSGGVGTLLRQVATWRVGFGWYALVLVGPIVLFVVSDLIYAVYGGVQPAAWVVIPSNLAFVGPLIAGSLGEELGWRGFAQPRLQTRYSALRASIIVGIIWGTWHLWPAMLPGGLADLTISDLAQTYVRLISTAIIYAWIYNSTNGSLFLVMVAHAGHNLATELVPIPVAGAHVVTVIVALLYLAVATAVVLISGPRTLSRPVART